MLISPVSDFKGGAEVVLRRMLSNPYIEPVLAVPEEGAIADAAAAMGVPVCYYRPGAMLHVHRPPRLGPIGAAVVDTVRCANRLRRLAQEHRCDVLHSNGLKPHMLCALLGTVSRLRTLVHLHDIPYRRSERLLWQLIARQVTQVIMVSRPCYPGPVLPANVKVVRNGIDMVCQTLPPARLPGPLRLGFVGRYHPNKGLDLLLDWFMAVCEQGIDATLTIRGRPDPDLPAYWEGIQARIRSSPHADRIREEGWTTGAATYAGLDVLLVTSRQPDPAPLVVPEAMSAGVIVAGYPAGGIPGMIEDGRTGFLVEDGRDLARKVSVLMQEPLALTRMRDAAHQAVQDEFGMGQFYQALDRVYRSIL